MAELSLLVKLVGNSASLDKATASGTKGLAAVGGAIGTADDAVKQFTGGVLSLGGALGALGGIAAGKALAGFVADGLAAADQTAKLARLRHGVSKRRQASFHGAADWRGAHLPPNQPA